MKKQSTKQNPGVFFYRFIYYALPAIGIMFSACSQPPQQQSQKNEGKKPAAVHNSRKYSYAAPKVVTISGANAPSVVKAGRPIIRLDTLNGGVPFFTNYNSEQGLALNSICCGFVDKAGNIWFGTIGGGVSRYDGKSFTNYTTAQGLAGNQISSIIQDKEGNMWFGTTGGGVSRYNGKSFINYTKAQGLADNFVWTITQDKHGNIWFGTNAGASRFDGKSFTNYTTTQGLADNIVWRIMQDRSGGIWFTTRLGGVSRYNGKTFTNYSIAQGLADVDVFSIMQDKADNIWFGTYGGVSRYDGKSFSNYTKAQGLGGNFVDCIMQDNAGNIWFGTDAGAIRFDGKSFTNYTTALGLAGNLVSTIVQDKAGSIWFCTSNGVSRYDGKSFTNYTTSLGLAYNYVSAITQDKAGSIWFGTYGGVSRYDGKSFSNYTKAQGLLDEVCSMVQDKARGMWFGNRSGGASRYDGKTFTSFYGALPPHTPFCIKQDSSGAIWFGTTVGAIRFDGKSFSNYTTAQGLAGNNLYSIMQDKAGNIWFGTYGGGASRFDGKRFTNYTTAQGLAGNFIYSIIQDKAGNIWFGTDGGGASRYDGKRFTNYTTAQGLADNVIKAIAEDPKRGIIWFATNQGLSGLRTRTSPKDNDQEYKFETFNKNTGYPIKDVNINAFIVDNNGILWAGTGDNKLIRFDYDAVNKNPAPLALQVEGIKVNGEDVCWNYFTAAAKEGKPADSLALLNEMVTAFGKVLPISVLDSMRIKYGAIKFDSIARFYPVPINLELPYEDRNLTFEFAAIEPGKPKQVKYQYKLAGYDKDWSPPGNGTTAVFGNIPEGKYTFELKALSPYGVWSNTEYTFSILPPWYRTSWAYLLYAVLFFCSIWTFIYYRSRALSKKNRLLEKKVQIRTKEVMEQKVEIESQRDNLEHQRNNLEKAFGELKRTQNQLIQSEKMASLGELTAGIAHEIQNPLNFVNNFSEVSIELLSEMETELNNGEKEEAIAIAGDLKQNLEKINQHGKRADAIVKGMLEHSRSRSGSKEPTDINKLADEFMRLSYHGLRSKDKSFNAELITHFDPTLPKIELVQQDIGRVMLNLFNNAFYAVNKKQKTAGKDYKPEVIVTTYAENGHVIIKVKDNGVGIPDAIKDKIMQPFFTTKPTGEGTGLGLSLTYDMVVKGHGGSIHVNSVEGEGSEFIISLHLH